MQGHKWHNAVPFSYSNLMGISCGRGGGACLSVLRSAVLASEQQLQEQWEGMETGGREAMQLFQEPCWFSFSWKFFFFHKAIFPSQLGNQGANPESLEIWSSSLTHKPNRQIPPSDGEDRNGKHCLISDRLCPFRFPKKSAKKNKCVQTPFHPTLQTGSLGPTVQKLPDFPVGTVSML